MARRLRGLVGRRRRPQLPMLTPLTVRGLHAQEPHRRVADGPVQGRGRCAAGLPPGAPGRPRLGGAALVFVEMTSPTPEGRITPGCPGLWNEDASGGLHASSTSCMANSPTQKSACSSATAAPRARPSVGWEGTDEPLPDGNWPLMAASAVPYGAQNQVPRAMTRADMDQCAQFVAAARRGPRPASTGWNCTAPTATCCPASSAR
jgi:anthraniloyl-CoA monooxygenase